MGADAEKPADLLQGRLELLILRTLAAGEKHGYEIAEWIHMASAEALSVEEGALYPALHRLELRGLVTAAWDVSANNRRAKYYRLTANGRKDRRTVVAEWLNSLRRRLRARTRPPNSCLFPLSRRSDMRKWTVCTSVVFLSALALRMSLSAEPSQSAAPQQIDLTERLAAGKLRAVNREVTALPGSRRGVHITEREGPGVVWIEGSDFAQGTIEVDVRGRDVLQKSFVGVAFHRKDDHTYDGVYLRPFNFKADDPVRHKHAVQYIAVPDFDWPRLRKEFPDEFENPVDSSLAPTEWVPLRVVVKGRTVQVYAGGVKAPTLEVRKLGSQDRGLIGLWVGNGSDGDFANLRITQMK